MKEYVCYILRSLKGDKYVNKTYVGCTNDFPHRLRQHNGEIVGGAKATRTLKPLAIYCVVTGFRTKIEALQFEWYIKHPLRKRRKSGKYCGVIGRFVSLRTILENNIYGDMPITLWFPRQYLKNIKSDAYREDVCLIPIDTMDENYLFC